jgi:mannosyltransferase OCH1-like enzyme
MRYIYLYELGGIFVDMYVERIDHSLDHMLDSSSLVLFMRLGDDGVETISESLIASEPGHPFIKAVIEQIILNISVKNNTNCGTTCVSGSSVLTKVYNRFISSTVISSVKKTRLATNMIPECASTNQLFSVDKCKANITSPSYAISYSPDVSYSDDIDFDSCVTSECYRSQFTLMRDTLSESLSASIAFSSHCESDLRGNPQYLNTIS